MFKIYLSIDNTDEQYRDVAKRCFETQLEKKAMQPKIFKSLYPKILKKLRNSDNNPRVHRRDHFLYFALL